MCINVFIYESLNEEYRVNFNFFIIFESIWELKDIIKNFMKKECLVFHWKIDIINFEKIITIMILTFYFYKFTIDPSSGYVYLSTSNIHFLLLLIMVKICNLEFSNESLDTGISFII